MHRMWQGRERRTALPQQQRVRGELPGWYNSRPKQQVSGYAIPNHFSSFFGLQKDDTHQIATDSRVTGLTFAHHERTPAFLEIYA